MTTPIKVAVTGAAGRIGYATVFRLAMGDLCGDRPIELRLLEAPGMEDALAGIAMELVDCAPKQLVNIVTGTDPEKVFDGINAAMLIGAAPRKPGMERADLLKANGGIFAAQGKAIAKVAADDVRVVVTGNPANTNAYIAAHNAGDVPAERFSALSRLDHNRAVSTLAAFANVPIDAVHKVSVWGNHSATQYVDLYHAEILGRSALEWVDEGWLDLHYQPEVAKRGTAVLKQMGRSSAASAAHATICHLRDWLRGTQPGDWTSMAVPSDGSYGVPEGLVCSFPVTCNAGDYQIVPGLQHNALAKRRIERSVQELVDEAQAVKQLGLLS